MNFESSVICAFLSMEAPDNQAPSVSPLSTHSVPLSTFEDRLLCNVFAVCLTGIFLLREMYLILNGLRLARSAASALQLEDGLLYMADSTSGDSLLHNNCCSIFYSFCIMWSPFISNADRLQHQHFHLNSHACLIWPKLTLSSIWSDLNTSQHGPVRVICGLPMTMVPTLCQHGPNASYFLKLSRTRSIFASVVAFGEIIIITKKQKVALKKAMSRRFLSVYYLSTKRGITWHVSNLHSVRWNVYTGKKLSISKTDNEMNSYKRIKTERIKSNTPN